MSRVLFNDAEGAAPALSQEETPDARVLFADDPTSSQGEQNQGADQSVMGAVQAALQGATLGFGDEIQALIATLVANAGKVQSPFADEMSPNASIAALDDANRVAPIPLAQDSPGEQFDTAVGELRQENRDFAKENPGTALAANVAGGLMTGGTLLRGAQALRVPISGLPGMAATGGTVGALAGAGTADGKDLATSATLGAILGAGGGIAVSSIASGARAVWRRLAPGVQNRFQKMAEASGMTPSQIETRLRALGPKATIADVDAVFQRAADVSASRLGPAAKKVQALIRRDETQFSRLMEPIKRTLGGDDAAATTVSALKDIRMQRASPLYEQAFDAGVQNTPRLMSLLKRPETMKAWRAVQSIGKSDPDVDIALLGKGAEPSFRGWQSITESLWDRASALDRAGKHKFAGAINRLRNAILGELDAQSPAFAQARGLWAGTKQADDMLELGGQFFKMSASEIRDRFKTMTDADKAFYRMGLGRQIEQKLAGTTDTNDLARVFRNKAFRDKALAVFPDRASAVDFMNTVKAETIKKSTSNAVARGSQTQPRQVVEKQLTGGQIGTEDVSKAGIINRVMGAVSGPREATIQKIGEMLLSQDPAVQQQALRMLQGASSAPRLAATPAGAATANLAGQDRP